MKTEIIYYLILFVYVSLWTCQLVASHLTHSLIILTDFYINLFKILDILLGLVHLRTQQQLASHRLLQESSPIKERLEDAHSTASSLFNCKCTYQFKRLPLLGSFVNGLFLMALLMSASIEGIQTCIHFGHSPKQANILTQNPLTYPLTLIGFAIVGLVMQYCSLKAHEMRDEELCSNSLIDLRAQANTTFSGCAGVTTVRAAPRELSANQLVCDISANNALISSSGNSFNMTQSLQTLSSKQKIYDLNLVSQTLRKDFKNRRSLELADATDDAGIQRISMRSLGNLEQLSHNSKKFSNNKQENDIEASNQSIWKQSNRDIWFWVRYLSSPMALITCALIILSVDKFTWLIRISDDIIEISDATLALVVVVSLFAGSFLPMKRAGKVLLQTAPAGMDLIEIEQKLKALSCHILEIRDLHVWSLTPRNNRVATCSLVLNTKKIEVKSQVEQILDEAKFVFLEHNIKCTTIEPILISEQSPATALPVKY